MFMITYNCRGYNSIKACFIKKLLSQCDVLFIQEHWLLRDKLHLLQNISEEFIVFSKSSIDDGKLLIGRPYGGTAIFIRKSIKCTITNCDIECDRLNAMIVDFYNFTVLITCFYMPCDSNNCDGFSSTIGAFQALKAKHAPSYVICAGDFNVDLSRLQSTQTSLFKQFCNEESLISVHTIGNQVEYTYCSDISGVKSTLDHFVISNELSDCINKHCIIEDIENRSDHAPLCVDVTLPIIKSNIKDTRHFIPKPKWHAVTSTSLSHYKLTLDELLCKLDIPDDVLSCSNVFCELHSSFISSLHEHIVSSLVTAAQESITFTQPCSKPNRTHPGWNEFVKPFQSEALDWHSVWINSGRPQSGFVYDMRRSTRKAYHEKVDSVLKREKQIKGIRIADSYLNSNSRDFWKEAELLRGRKRGPSAAVEGLTNGDDIANAFSRYYDDLYNSVDFDHSEMRELYSDVNDRINCCSYGDHSHAISDSSVDDAIKKLKIGKSDGYDGLTSDYIINGTPLLTHYLSLLFSLMLSHCYTPTSFCVSTMIPIPKKGSGSMNDIRNYRGIALSSLLSKLFDHCIICNQYDSLRSDDLQFAYKSKISAIHCVNSVNETVNYYINN